MQVIVLNGPINAGKTTTGKALAALINDAQFIDGDDHDAPDDAPLTQRIEASFAHIEHLIASATARVVVVAVPLRDVDFDRLRSAATARKANLTVVTLAPPVSIGLTNRGGRVLSPQEVERAQEMYAEGFGNRPFSDFIIVDMTGPHATAVQIAERLQLPFRA